MGVLAGVSGKDAVRRFCKVGYTPVRQRGSHIRLLHFDNNHHKPLTIPLKKELKLGLLHQLIKDANLTVKEFLDL